MRVCVRLISEEKRFGFPLSYFSCPDGPNNADIMRTIASC